MRRTIFCGLLLLALLTPLNFCKAAIRQWIDPTGGFWDIIDKWQFSAPPANFAPYPDGAEFNLGATYEVLFDGITGDRTINDLNVSGGDVTFRSTSVVPYRLSMNGSGGANQINVSSTAHLRVGTASNPFNMDAAGDINVHFGGVLTLGASTGPSSLLSTSSNVNVYGQLLIENYSSNVFLFGAGDTLTTAFGGLTSFRGTNDFGYIPPANSTVIVKDPGSKLEVTQSGIQILSSAQFNVSNGGILTVADYFSVGNGSQGTMTVSDPGSRVEIPLQLLLGYYGGFINVYNGGRLTVGNNGATYLYNSSVLTINGGYADLQNLSVDGGTLNFVSGSLSYKGDLNIGPGGYLGAYVNLDSGKDLTLSGTTTILPFQALTISGGALRTGALQNNGGTLAFYAGTLEITGTAGLTIGAGGPLGNTYSLGAGRTINVANATTITAGSLLSIDGGARFSSNSLNNSDGGELYLNGPTAQVTGTTLANNGLIRGEGKLTASVTNNSTGELRAESGRRIKFEGLNGANAGQINLQGGTAEFVQPLTNSITGQIVGRGTLITGGTGLTNVGHIALSSGISDIFGDVLNNTGNAARGISISGNADVTFWDDVTNTSGLFRVSAGSSATFFGSYAGGGISGGGTVYFEGDITPGFSPALAQFEGDVSFGAAASLVMELGGTTLGDEYDHLRVLGLMELAGVLDVDLLYGFEPSLGQTFDLFDAGAVSGRFSAIELPALGGGLAWDTGSLYSSGTIGVTAIPEPGVWFMGALLAGCAVATGSRRVRAKNRNPLGPGAVNHQG
jgi:T5SS/PEP-CTERM-associated repeat protein